MKLPVKFLELEEQRRRIGAELSRWELGSPGLAPRDQLLTDLATGIEIPLGDVDVSVGGLLAYRGEQVLLYIKDTGSTLDVLRNEPHKSRRFHVADCETLESMRKQGRFERYVVTNRMDGYFLVDWRDLDIGRTGETEAALCVCRNCLKLLNWRGYENPEGWPEHLPGERQRKKMIWENFSIGEFLMDYATFFRSRPSRRDAEAGLNEYVLRWPEISAEQKRRVNWTCHQCGVHLGSLRAALHCHHKNGVRNDNSSANLVVLCAMCHAEQPGHGHMKVSISVREKILENRRRQGIATA